MGRFGRPGKPENRNRKYSDEFFSQTFYFRNVARTFIRPNSFCVLLHARDLSSQSKSQKGSQVECVLK